MSLKYLFKKKKYLTENKRHAGINPCDIFSPMIRIVGSKQLEVIALQTKKKALILENMC